MNEMNLKQEPRPEKQATTSIISAVIGWICLGVLIFLVNAQMGVEMLAFTVLITLCLLLIVVLPLAAITRGIRAIQTGAQLKIAKKAQAWAGVVLGALLYLAILGYWLLALKIT